MSILRLKYTFVKRIIFAGNPISVLGSDLSSQTELVFIEDQSHIDNTLWMSMVL